MTKKVSNLDPYLESAIKNAQNKTKMENKAKKQEKLWKHLIVGDDPDNEQCGEPWDEWNTEVIPNRQLKKVNKSFNWDFLKEKKETKSENKYIDYAHAYNCSPINQPKE